MNVEKIAPEPVEDVYRITLTRQEAVWLAAALDIPVWSRLEEQNLPAGEFVVELYNLVAGAVEAYGGYEMAFEGPREELVRN